jgi:hypothetical protein
MLKHNLRMSRQFRSVSALGRTSFESLTARPVSTFSGAPDSLSIGVPQAHEEAVLGEEPLTALPPR